MVKALVHPEWVRRLNLFGDVVGDPQHIVGLDPDELLAVARASTGLTDTGEDEWPGWDDTYRRLLTSIDTESQLHLLGRVLTRGEMLRILRTWLRLQDAWTRRPGDPRDRDRRAAVRRRSTAFGHDDPPRTARAGSEPAHAARLGSARAAPGRHGRRRDRSRAAARARGVRAGVLVRHPSRVHDDARARERPSVRVRALPLAGRRRSVLVDALRHAELHRLAARAPRDARPCLPPPPPDAPDICVRRRDRAAAALAAEVARSPLDAAAGVRRVPRRTRHPHAPRPTQVHRVAREPPRGPALHPQRPRRRRRARSDDGADLPDVPRAGDRATRRTERFPTNASSTATSSI